MSRRHPRRRPFIAAVASVVALTARLVAGADVAEAAAPILGSGSTFAEVALDAWAADIYAQYGLSVDFSGNGSVGGLLNFQDGIVDFASSDVPYAPGQDGRRGYRYVPIVAGGTALMYNVLDEAGNRITNLRLTPQTIANIFFGKIRTWTHESILRENPELDGVIAEGQEIRLGVRSAGSGTTGVFTDFLSTTAPGEWQDFVARSQAITLDNGNYITEWPADSAQFNCWCSVFAGSNEIANWVAQRSAGSIGAIGYAEAAYADIFDLPVVRVRNAAGFYRLPDARSVAVALLEATENPDGTQNLQAVHTSPRDEAYPASSYNYLVIPDSADFDPDKGATLSEYLVYSITIGQDSAAGLGYSPLPPNLVQFALNRNDIINGNIPTPPLGNWGRAYEALAPDVPQEVPEPVDTTPVLSPDETPVGETPGGPAPGEQTPGAAAPGGPAGQTPGNQPGATPGAATTTTVVGAAGRTGGATGRGLDETTQTSILASGEIVTLSVDEDDVSERSRTDLCDLQFEDGEIVSCDGEAVPAVKGVGIGQMLGVAGVVVGLLLLPPLVIGPFVRRRRDRAEPVAT